MLCTKASAGSLNTGLHRQHAKGLYGLRKTGPALRGFSGESSACNPRCIVKYASALELARSQVTSFLICFLPFHMFLKTLDSIGLEIACFPILRSKTVES